MKEYKTNPGGSYCITAISIPCAVSACLETGKSVLLARITESGQAVIVAPSDKITTDQNDAIVSPVFKGASIGSSGGGKAMCDVVIPSMPDDGVDLMLGHSYIVETPTNNLYIKSIGRGTGESRLFFTAESGGVLNVIAPVCLKWLNGNKTHYVNAGDTVAVSVCNGLITVGSYS